MSPYDFATVSQQFHLASTERHCAINAEMSPALATAIATKHNYQNQRPCSPKHVQVLAEAIRRHEFREYTNIDFAVLDGEPHLINGQHTLRAIAAAKQPVWLSLHFHRVENKAEIERLYSKYDIGRLRSIRDVMGEIGNELGLQVKERDTLAVAVKCINLGFRALSGGDDPSRIYEARDFELKKQLMRDWAKEARQFFQAIHPAPGFNKGLFFRGPVLAVALLTIRHHQESAIEFWGGAAMDDGLRVGDPRKALINWLRNNSVGKAQTMQHRAAISCWNAWHKARKLMKVYPDTGASLEILGTDIVIASGRG